MLYKGDNMNLIYSAQIRNDPTHWSFKAADSLACQPPEQRRPVVHEQLLFLKESGGQPSWYSTSVLVCWTFCYIYSSDLGKYAFVSLTITGDRHHQQKQHKYTCPRLVHGSVYKNELYLSFLFPSLSACCFVLPQFNFALTLDQRKWLNWLPASGLGPACVYFKAQSASLTA